MRRPHRTLLERLRRQATGLGRQLPAPVRRRLRALVTPGPGTVPDSVPAEAVASFDAWREVGEVADVACRLLADQGVEVARLERSGQVSLVIGDHQWTTAIAALASAPACRSWVVRGPNRRPAALHALDPLTAAGNLTIHRRLTSTEGRPVHGQVALGLQRWQRSTPGMPRPDGGVFAPGTLLAPGRHPVAPYLSPAQWDAAQQRPDRRPPATVHRQLLEFAGPIDVVYTWVDDSDPDWQRRRASVAGGEVAGLSSDALDPARTRSRDELRYSLRSLAANAGWVRHVWLVTDGQMPPWLDRDCPGLTVVSHAEIFAAPDALPVFNSHAIESQLHHVPGLAEHFLYLNDDVFFGRPVRPELFFHGNGLPKFMVSSTAIDLDWESETRNGASLAARRGREWLEANLGRTVTRRMQHVPHAHLKSSLAALEAEAGAELDRVQRSRFRHRDDLSIASDLGHYHAYAAGRAVTGTLAFQYVDIDSPHAPEHLANLLATRAADCFCINDVGGADGPQPDADVVDFLAAYFPVPSRFEKAGR